MAPGTRFAALLLLTSACVFDGNAVGSGDPGEPGGEPLADASATEPDPTDLEPDAAPEPEPDADVPAGGEDAGAEDRCPPHRVRARRHHTPPRSEDGTLSFGERRRLHVPAELPVTSGNAGDHCAHLDFHRGGNVVRCLYQGGAGERVPTPGSAQWAAGLVYAFQGCIEDPDDEEEGCELGDEGDIRAGDTLEIDELVLHLADGAYASGDPAAYDPTEVDLSIDEDCRRGGGGD